MSWTYTNDPENTTLDALRVEIGDVLSDDPQLTDQELNHFLAQSSNSVPSAALAAARFLEALYARKVDKAVGDLRLSYSQRAKAYRSLAQQLAAKVGIKKAMPFAGGISEAQKNTVENDTDRVAPAFKRNQFTRPTSEYDPLDYDEA